MIEYFTSYNAPEIDYGEIDISEEVQSIYVATPFRNWPSPDKSGITQIAALKYLILDVNLVSFIRRKNDNLNVSGLIKWAEQENAILFPMASFFEINRKHRNLRSVIDEFYRGLRTKFGYKIESNKIDALYSFAISLQPNNNANTKNFVLYLKIIKHYYHKNYSLKNKIKRFCEIINKRKLPVLSFVIYVGCVLFFVKEHKELYQPKVYSKVQSDMEYAPSDKEEEKKLWNMASDIMLFMACSELFYNYELNEYGVSYIASTDKLIGLLISELCIEKVTVNNDLSFWNPSFRDNSLSARVVGEIIISHLKQSSDFRFVNTYRMTKKIGNLSVTANELEALTKPSSGRANGARR